MKRFWVRVVTALAAIASSGALSSACAHNDSSFFLQDILAPPQGAATSGCIFTTDPTQPFLSEPILDVEAIGSFGGTYEAVFLAGNQLIPTANQLQLMTETDRIAIQGAVVVITDANYNQLTTFTALGAGFLNPASGSTPGYGAVQFTIVDNATINQFKQKLGWLEREVIITYTKAFGQTLGGDHLESNTLEVPITVCRGCLIEFDTDPTMTPTPNCYGLAPTTSTQAICFYGQDEPFDCHFCASDPYCLCGQATCP